MKRYNYVTYEANCMPGRSTNMIGTKHGNLKAYTIVSAWTQQTQRKNSAKRDAHLFSWFLILRPSSDPRAAWLGNNTSGHPVGDGHGGVALQRGGREVAVLLEEKRRQVRVRPWEKGI